MSTGTILFLLFAGVMVAMHFRGHSHGGGHGGGHSHGGGCCGGHGHGDRQGEAARPSSPERPSPEPTTERDASAQPGSADRHGDHAHV